MRHDLLIACKIEDRSKWALCQGRAVAEPDSRRIVRRVVQYIEHSGERCILRIVARPCNIRDLAYGIVGVLPLWVTWRRIVLLRCNASHVPIRGDIDVVADGT